MAKKTTSRSKSRTSARLDLRVTAASIVLLIGAGAGWLLWAGPSFAQVSDTTSQITAVQTQTTSTKTKLAALQSGQVSDAQSYLVKAQALDAQLPTTLDKGNLASLVPTAAAGFGLTVDRMDPVAAAAATPAPAGAAAATPDATPAAKPAAATPPKSLTFAMSVTGPRTQIIAFLGQLTSSTNPAGLMTVSDVSITVTAEKASATFTLTAFCDPTPALTPTTTSATPAAGTATTPAAP